MSFCDEKVINTSEEIVNNSIELVRKWTQDPNYTSWDYSYDASDINYNNNKTPPFVSTMISDDLSPSRGNVTNGSTQTEETLPLSCSIVDLSLSFSKECNDQRSASDHQLRSKRVRRDSMQDIGERRPWKKTKCTESCTSSNSDLTENENRLSIGASFSSNLLSSSSETSFKSIISNSSFKVRKRRGTPLKERNHRRKTKAKAWKIFELCTWIGKKGFQSIAGLYNEPQRVPIVSCEPKTEAPAEDVKELRKIVEKDNPIRTKSATQQPLVTQEMLKTTRAKLGRARPVAGSTPKQLLTDLEK
ncbi:Uncharacterized protein OBRU01_18194 [Operophtera brumata]|uniref:Uncharacterized protein n=1 Tax=Operophtera brumata TaxID=104452 RepID=A0A0L7KZH3_OPEBR|nr:Uncharacterized protein OBRU01_18194 [Operophtera brumata]